MRAHPAKFDGSNHAGIASFNVIAFLCKISDVDCLFVCYHAGHTGSLGPMVSSNASALRRRRAAVLCVATM